MPAATGRPRPCARNDLANARRTPWVSVFDSGEVLGGTVRPPRAVMWPGSTRSPISACFKSCPQRLAISGRGPPARPVLASRIRPRPPARPVLASRIRPRPPARPVLASRIRPRPPADTASRRGITIKPVQGPLLTQWAIATTAISAIFKACRRPPPPFLARPFLARPFLARPFLARPVLAGPIPARPVLAGPLPARPVLAGPAPRVRSSTCR